jgi:predicted PurR-regulated permease PerM
MFYWIGNLIGKIVREIFVMRGRERLFATAAIWIAFAIVMNNLINTFTHLYADFSGLWPGFNFYGPQPPMTDAQIANLQEMMDKANELSQTLAGQVNQTIAAQLANNMPTLVILSLALILAATLSTYFVWHKAHLEPEASAASNRDTGSKVKRGSRVDLVVNALDEEELAELRARLYDAGEMDAIPLEELLAEQHQRRR